MWYVESAPIYCATTETIKDTANITVHKIGKATFHWLDILADTLSIYCNPLWEVKDASPDKAWNNMISQKQKSAPTHVEVYLDYFI